MVVEWPEGSEVLLREEKLEKALGSGSTFCLVRRLFDSADEATEKLSKLPRDTQLVDSEGRQEISLLEQMVAHGARELMPLHQPGHVLKSLPAHVLTGLQPTAVSQQKPSDRGTSRRHTLNRMAGGIIWATVQEQCSFKLN